MKKLDTSSYKGVRDFYPEDMFIHDYIISVWHYVLQSYGYEHYSASILEPSEIYKNKTSDEIVNEQTYSFIDRGKREVTLRPEMTPTVARMVAKKQRELPLPLRWYSIPNVFRYERPQKGRLREHWQLNVDIFGLKGLEAEVELIEIATSIMNRFGLKSSDFVVKINDREILNDLMKDLGLDDGKQKEFNKVVDQKDNIKNFNEKMERLIGQSFDMTIDPNERIKELTEKLGKRGIDNVVFDPLLIRGFDYYTGIVFEIFDTNPNNSRSLFGGGRYDNLLEMFEAEKVPTAGFGMGDVTIQEALTDQNLLPTAVAQAHIAICTLDPSVYDYAAKLAKDLRESGVDVVVNYTDRKIGDQIKRADKKGIPFVICIGENEVKENEIKVKNLSSGKEEKMDREKIAEFVRSKL